jgi:ssDNA-binding Zn-finger/Zn-ribbon topoisomerase 1
MFKCGTTLHKWGKGTDDYRLLTKEDIKKRQEYEDSKPICICGAKMTVRKSEYGYFGGCTRYPECTHTKNYK